MKHTFLPVSALVLALFCGACAKEDKQIIVKSKKSGAAEEAAPESTTPPPAEAVQTVGGNPAPKKKNPTKYSDEVVERACLSHEERQIETFRKYYNPLATKGEKLHTDNMKILNTLKEIVEADPAALEALKGMVANVRNNTNEIYSAIFNNVILPYLRSSKLPVAFTKRQCFDKSDLSKDRYNYQGCEKMGQVIGIPYMPLMARDALSFIDDETKQTGLRICAMSTIELTEEDYNASPFSYRSPYSEKNGSSYAYLFNPIFVCSELLFTPSGLKITNGKFLDASRNPMAFEYFLDMYGYARVSKRSQRSEVKKPDYLLGLDGYLDKHDLDICKQQ